jgi:hypothetical protein
VPQRGLCFEPEGTQDAYTGQRCTHDGRLRNLCRNGISSIVDCDLWYDLG